MRDRAARQGGHLGLLRRYVISATLVAVALYARRAGAAPVIRASEATSHIGESVTVQGQIDSVVCSPVACLLSFQPNLGGLIASISSGDLGSFPSPKATYEGKAVRITGTVTQRNGRPRIDVASPKAIEILPPGSLSYFPSESRPAPAARATEAPQASPGRPHVWGPAGPRPGEVRSDKPKTEPTLKPGQERQARPSDTPGRDAAQSGDDVPAAASITQLLADVRVLRQQVADLTDQIGTLNGRIEDLERSAASSQPAAAEEAVPQQPSYVVRERRSLSLRHVSRGWTAQQVVEALGEPGNVTGIGTGMTTWYYDNGRAVTLDARGRVVSTSGF
jgi:hypothetical protein